MRIWILTQFYPPEIGAAATRLSRLARLLAADGHEMTVLTGMPNYPAGVIPAPYRGHLFYREQIDGVQVRRVWVYATPQRTTKARLLNQFSFLLMSALAGVALPRPDVILVESHPLFVCLSAGWLRRVKRAPMVLNVSDLWPESAIATGALRADSAIVKVAERVERWAYNDAAHMVAMTQGVQDGIVRVHRRAERVTLIPNAVDLSHFRPGLTAERDALRVRYGLGNQFVVAHVGNMSLTYDFQLIIDVATALPEYTFFFAGGGSQADYIQREVESRNLRNVVLAGVLPHEQMPAVWAAADACLIALADHSVAGGTRPAKMYEAMASGTPIVAAIRGEGATLLEQAGAGIVTPIGEPGATVTALRRLAEHPDERQRMAASGRAYAEAHLSPATNAQAYLTVLKEAAGKA